MLVFQYLRTEKKRNKNAAAFQNDVIAGREVLPTIPKLLKGSWHLLQSCGKTVLDELQQLLVVLISCSSITKLRNTEKCQTIFVLAQTYE